MARNYIYCLKCGETTTNIWQHHEDRHPRKEPPLIRYDWEGLTPTENKLFRLLAKTPGWIVPREVLVKEGLGYPWFEDDDANVTLLRSHIRNLRRKVAPLRIITDRGRGYHLEGGVYVVPDPKAHAG